MKTKMMDERVSRKECVNAMRRQSGKAGARRELAAARRCGISDEVFAGLGRAKSNFTSCRLKGRDCKTSPCKYNLQDGVELLQE